MPAPRLPCRDSLCRTALEQEDLARGLIGSGKKLTNHRAIGARHRLQVARIFDSTVTIPERSLPRRFRRIHDRRELRHAAATMRVEIGPTVQTLIIGGIDQRPPRLPVNLCRRLLAHSGFAFDASDGIENALQ